ncbi:uncharacterized protein LOC110069147 [Orbicella faveolata]|uniref:uncharacterized protein LOC110069147 n=1 Tax=Orbicella faveolata TaxID=48498 RepID=UPI0009E21F01|nr:uncharacterized protein LOC110069147 [Orbicella faveolata]
MLRQFDSFPTARIYLQAYKLVKEGLEVLRKSNFTDARGISLIAHGYLTENSILQAFPLQQNELLPNILQLCEENLYKNPCFFEGLLLSIAFRGYPLAGKVSLESMKGDRKTLMCFDNLIHFIQTAEPDSPPSVDPLEFDKTYSSWLHVLYYHMAAIYTIAEAAGKAAEAFESSLKCCPSYYDAKRGLGYNLMTLYSSKTVECHEDIPEELPPNKSRPCDREMSKYASWTAEELRDTAVKVLQEYLAEAPQCDKNYPNACYYLAHGAFLNTNQSEFRKYFELGQDAEEKRLPFFHPVDLPIKDMLSPCYQLFANVMQPVSCGNKSCTKKVKESDLKSCGRCGK